MITAIIVDDEEKGRITLQDLVNKYCTSVKILELCDSVEEALKAIDKHNPQLVFLDIEMPYENGFTLLEKVKEPGFDVIFVTAYGHYAIQAIKSNAIDYLLKPIDVDELKIAIDKVEKRQHSSSERLKNFESLLSAVKSKSAKIAVPTFDGLQMIRAEDIIKCVADECYTEIHLTDGKKIVVSKLLKEYEGLLSGLNFFRVHNSCLINLAHVNRYVKGEGGYVIMSDGENVEVSRRKKAELLTKLSYLQI
ncbi:MAG: DNA-binding response regulator [Bacteroidetes bacterium]|jgi:two-component system LytT family response regulator|nr:DNA-binding response regulator [Bacteroidota bacterium]